MKQLTPEEQEFIILLVRDMRHNQRRFKNLGKKDAREAAEKLEAKVDDFIAKVTSTQQNLF